MGLGVRFLEVERADYQEKAMTIWVIEIAIDHTCGFSWGVIIGSDKAAEHEAKTLMEALQDCHPTAKYRVQPYRRMEERHDG